MIKGICELYGVNEEQARALDIKNNTALRAGAGSGKTRVLTKRFVRLLIENPDISLDNIVAITFTKKAATEMKDRIRKELSEKSSKTSDEVEKKRLANLKMKITGANIDTIHGFCGKMIRENFTYLGVDPDFGIFEEVDKNILLSKLADVVMGRFIEDPENDKAIQVIIGIFSARFFTGKFKEGIIAAYKGMREKGYRPESFIKEADGDRDDVDNPTVILERMAAVLIAQLDKQYGDYKNKELLLDFNDLEILTENLLGDKSIKTSYFKRFATIMVDEFQDVNPLQKRIIDHLTIDDGKIPAGRLFVVGDHKQSIYGFRGSDYRVFEETCRAVSLCGSVENLNNCYRSTKNIINGTNKIFRQLLDPYEQLEYPREDHENGRKIELFTWEKASLKEKKIKTRWDSSKKLLLADDVDDLKTALEAEYDDTEQAGKKEYQGDVVAGVIQKLISEGFLYRDVAVLLRSRTSLGEIENALIKNEIPYCVLGGIGFWERPEVNDLLSLYKLIFYPDDRLALFSALRSPLFGFSDDLILSLSMYLQKEQAIGLDTMMDMFSKDLLQTDAWLVKRTADILAQLMNVEGILNAPEIMKKIMAVTAYDEILTVLPQGEKKFRNIEKLLRIVDEFEVKGVYTPRELLQYLEALKDSSGMDGEAFLDNEDSDAVKILTIHAAKGLEFKTVLIPDMDRLLDAQSKKYKPLFFVDREKGLIAMGLDKHNDLHQNANPAYAELYSKKLMDELEDSRRVFYVAATRAEQYLAFIGELQTVKETELLGDQNSFMKQLRWAMTKAGCVEEIISVDAVNLISNQQKGNMKNPDFIVELEKLAKGSCDEQILKPSLKPCEYREEGSISISSWMKFKDCPRRYYLENLVGMHDQASVGDGEEQGEVRDAMNAADFGTLLHAILEKVDVGNLDYLEAETKLSQFDKDLLRKSVQGFLRIEQEQKKYNRGKLVASLKEFGFRVPIADGTNLSGFIDRVDIYEKAGQFKAVIIDYKTNRVKDEQGVKEKSNYYEGQMRSYGWALNSIPFYKGQKVTVEEAVLYFVHIGEAVSVNLDSHGQEVLVKELITSTAYLLGSHDLSKYQCRQSITCDWCNCKMICADLG